MTIEGPDALLTNRIWWLRRWPLETEEAVDWACALFPPDTRARGLARGYYDYLWVLQEVLQAVGGQVAGLRVLDIGCGAGVLDLALTRLGARVSGLDRFEEYEAGHDNQMGTTLDIVERLRTHGIEVLRRDVASEGLPEDEGAYDLVLLLAVIEHLHESPKSVLAGIHRLLRPGGHVVITTPNHAWLRTRLRLFAGRSAHHPLDDWWRTPFFGHVREYTLPELRRMLEWSGFEIRHATIGNWLHVASRVRGRNGSPDRWTTRFLLNSPERLAIAASLLITALVPSLRY
ncbi:MAG TPA: methyltransferase domain-containing protein, partial [Gemmatimonadales bacterium]|nr:methyltransferase domain-containing protein [Gemmatimonadales bacterium]